MFGFLGWPLKIGIASSPNTFAKDRLLALELLFKPYLWQKGRTIGILEEAFANYFSISHAVSFESGRVALYQILKGWGIGVGDEVIVPAYTCVVVPDAVLWTGAAPAYADIEEDTFNMDARKLDRLITEKTRAIVVQHTFGQAANLEAIVPWARQHGIKVIEDCAQSLGGRYQGELLGTFGDAAFFSFGQEKSISSVRGGLVITSDPHLGRTLETTQKRLSYPQRWIIFKRLLHLLLWGVINPTYYFFNLGKAIIFLTRGMKLLGSSISEEETRGGLPEGFPQRLPNALAALAYLQFQRIEELNKRRREIAAYYISKLKDISPVKLPRVEEGAEPSFLRFALRVPDPERLTRRGKKAHIILGNWYNSVPYPRGVNQQAVRYEAGSCSVAERVAARTVNLPTSPTMSLRDAKRVVKLMRERYED